MRANELSAQATEKAEKTVQDVSKWAKWTIYKARLELRPTRTQAR